MTMTREEIEQLYVEEPNCFETDMEEQWYKVGLKDGLAAADQHPQWYDAQGDIVPEYDREVIVIGRDGKVFFGHRPDPKGYVVVEGKKCFAKTYDKNGWNWPNIALWLDVEIPEELIDKIVSE